jgi:Integrase core domain/ATP dependent DNA ligase domain
MLKLSLHFCHLCASTAPRPGHASPCRSLPAANSLERQHYKSCLRKSDGFRRLVRKSGDRVELLSRNGNLMNTSFPDIVQAVNRKALGIEIDFSLPSERVIRTLRQIIDWRGTPRAIRCDNGPEYLSSAITEWAKQSGIRLDHIQPGKPQQNAYVERFNRTVRYEWLSQYHWENLEHVRSFATEWMWTYNHDRPNRALGGITPKQRLAMAA